jgi:hypothetical protein
MSSDKERDTEAGGGQGLASEGDPPIIVDGQEGTSGDAEASASEGDPPIIVEGR